MKRVIEVDPYDLSDAQADVVTRMVQEEMAAREALAEALGWDWGPGPGTPSVGAVVAGVVAELDARGFSLVPKGTEK